MPDSAKALHTTVEALSGMTPERQLDYVFKYLDQPRLQGKVKSLDDMYMAVLWPQAVGRPAEDALFRQKDTPTRYAQNRTLDQDKNGEITKAEAAARVKGPLDHEREMAWVQSPDYQKQLQAPSHPNADDLRPSAGPSQTAPVWPPVQFDVTKGLLPRRLWPATLLPGTQRR